MLYCNRRLASMLGVPQERVIGQKLQPFMLAEDVAEFVGLLDKAKRVGARSELTLCNESGKRVPVYLSLSLLQRDDGATLLCGVLTDLTEQKLHLRELAEANARLSGRSPSASGSRTLCARRRRWRRSASSRAA